MENQYVKMYDVAIMEFDTMTIVIEKVKKVGTKRTFFKTTYNGNNVCRTLRSRLYDAKKVAREYYKLKNK